MIQSDLVFIWIVQETSLLACVVLRNSVDARKNSNIKERYLFVYYKVLSAQNAGAIAVIVVNTESESIAVGLIQE
jgi:CMP-N-acetylneuraminic acid synthetase